MARAPAGFGLARAGLVMQVDDGELWRASSAPSARGPWPLVSLDRDLVVVMVVRGSAWLDVAEAS